MEQDATGISVDEAPRFYLMSRDLRLLKRCSDSHEGVKFSQPLTGRFPLEIAEHDWIDRVRNARSIKYPWGQDKISKITRTADKICVIHGFGHSVLGRLGVK